MSTLMSVITTVTSSPLAVVIAVAALLLILCTIATLCLTTRIAHTYTGVIDYAVTCASADAERCQSLLELNERICKLNDDIISASRNILQDLDAATMRTIHSTVTAADVSPALMTKLLAHQSSGRSCVLSKAEVTELLSMLHHEPFLTTTQADPQP